MTMSPATGVGYVLIGTYFNVCLLGLSFVQAYLYYTRYGRDPWGIKSVVLVLLACDIANTVCVCTCVYLWLVTHYGQVAYLNEILPSFLGALQSTSITTAICQLVRSAPAPSSTSRSGLMRPRARTCQGPCAAHALLHFAPRTPYLAP